MSGPPPEPTQLRALRGNPSKRALNPDEPKGPLLEGEVLPPSFLGARARRYWREIIPVLQRMKVFTESDIYAVAMMANDLATYAEMQPLIRKHGRTHTVVNRNGGETVVRRPEVGIANEAAANFMRWADRFGMDAAYRSKLKVEAEQEVDPLDELRRRGSRGPAG